MFDKKVSKMKGALPIFMLLVMALSLGFLGLVTTFVSVGHVVASSSQNISNGVSSGLSAGGSVFTEATVALVVGILFIGAFSLQIARNYFLRILDKFTLRLGADIWWLAYVLIRDGLMFAIVLMGFELFYVGTYTDYPIAVPFMPLAIVFIAAALATKLIYDTDESENANRFVSILIAAGTFLYVIGVVFVTENIIGYANANYTTTSTGTITTPAGGSNIWTYMYNTFSSTVNTTLALDSFYVCFALLSLIALIVFVYVTFPVKIGRNAKATDGPSTRKNVVEEE